MILIGLIVIVVGLLMAVTRSNSRLPGAAENARRAISHYLRHEAVHGFAVNANRYIFRSMEPYRVG